MKKMMFGLLLAIPLATFIAVPACTATDGDEGEGEGEGEDQSSASVAFCAKLAECELLGDQTEAECVSGNDDAVAAAAGQGDPICADLADATDAFNACIATKTCDDLNENGADACASENAALTALQDGGAEPCYQGQPPIDIPAGWECNAGFYAANDGCDCGCGATDPDCATGCSEPSCNDDAVCDFCYDAGGVGNDVCNINCDSPIFAEPDTCESGGGVCTNNECLFPSEGEGEGEGAAEGEGEGAAEGEGEGAVQ